MADIKNIKEEILLWNSRFPLDRWWREKHGVALWSEAHMSASQLDILFEFLEDSIVDEQRKSELTVKKDNNNDRYIPGSGDIFKASSLVLSEEEFDSIDINNLSDKEDKNGRSDEKNKD